MPNGIYAVSFSVGPNQGTGVVELKDGHLFGGDSEMYYAGEYREIGDRITGTLKIAKHSDVPGMQSIFGIDEYQLLIDGTFNPGGPGPIKGTTPRIPGAEMTIIFRPVSS